MSGTNSNDQSDQRAMPDESELLSPDPRTRPPVAKAMPDESELLSPDPRTRPPATKAMPDESELMPPIDDE